MEMTRPIPSHPKSMSVRGVIIPINWQKRQKTINPRIRTYRRITARPSNAHTATCNTGRQKISVRSATTSASKSRDATRLMQFHSAGEAFRPSDQGWKVSIALTSRKSCTQAFGTCRNVTSTDLQGGFRKGFRRRDEVTRRKYPASIPFVLRRSEWRPAP